MQCLARHAPVVGGGMGAGPGGGLVGGRGGGSQASRGVDGGSVVGGGGEFWHIAVGGV